MGSSGVIEMFVDVVDKERDFIIIILLENMEFK